MPYVSTSEFQRLLRRDRVIVVFGLAVTIAISWLYLFQGAGMEAAGGMAAAMAPANWSAGYAAIMFVMWAVMMVAMMLPGAIPMILLFTNIARRRQRPEAAALTGAFAAGYVVAWGGFSLGAVGVQYLMAEAAVISPMMHTTNVALAGAILIGAGIWQWTPLKDTCLRHCRSPLNFLLRDWRDGASGAFAMGLHHGGYCLGCCWVLMLLLFVGGVMNMLWIAGLALYVLLEKVMPAGRWLGRLAGLLLVVWGGGVLFSIV